MLCTPTVFYVWPMIPQDSSASTGWFVKPINEIIKGLEQVAAYTPRRRDRVRL